MLDEACSVPCEACPEHAVNVIQSTIINDVLIKIIVPKCCTASSRPQRAIRRLPSLIQCQLNM